MTTLNIRNIDPEAVAKLKLAAAARGLTIGQYVAKLADLHDVARAHGCATLDAELEALGLQTVER